MTTTIHIVRHGEVDNPEGVLYGRLPAFGLTRRGHYMAREVAESFHERGNDVVAVIASPLLRAQQTAAPIARAYGLEVECDPRLIESANVFEGQRINSDPKIMAHPKNWRHFLRPLQPSWGESYTEVASRMRAAVSAALRQAAGHEAVLVSHQMPIVTLTRFAQKKALPHSPFTRHCSLASVTSLIFQDSTLVGMTYEEPAAHLLEGALDMTPGDSAAGVRR
ncbi:MAG: histidine phosphatase family protein [Actinomycetaceae bacterium]|nr:histidine phosphatase family protein [Actinomycetaceae bacterium]